MNGTGAIITAVSDDAKQKGLQINDELTHILDLLVEHYPTQHIRLMIDSAHGKKDHAVTFKFSSPWTPGRKRRGHE